MKEKGLAVELESFGISDTGLVRQNNEDVFAELPDPPLFVLADGMGGHQAGEIAAREAVMSLCQFIHEKFSKDKAYSNSALIALVLEGIQGANAWVYHLATKEEHLDGMGTTLCSLLFYQQTIIYAHVGDSRIYRFRQHRLEKLTQDHSLRSERMNKGQLHPFLSASNSYKNIITRAIGTNGHVQPDLAAASILSEDIYFLCSDGLTDSLSDQEMTTIIETSNTIKQACQQLVHRAKAKGGTDNITIVMIKVLS